MRRWGIIMSLLFAAGLEAAGYRHSWVFGGEKEIPCLLSDDPSLPHKKVIGSRHATWYDCDGGPDSDHPKHTKEVLGVCHSD